MDENSEKEPLEEFVERQPATCLAAVRVLLLDAAWRIMIANRHQWINKSKRQFHHHKSQTIHKKNDLQSIYMFFYLSA
jgi:hypothetical protein